MRYAVIAAGAFASAGLRDWHEILVRWCAIIEQHCRIASREVLPWWDTEVANAALLSSAAIQCGYASLVEAGGTKAGGGRSDLWVQFGPQETAGAQEEYLELKLARAGGAVDAQALEAAIADAADPVR